MDPIPILFLVSSIILLGFAASVLFKKTGLPDILVLIILGMIFGPGLHILHEDIVCAIIEPVGALAIAVILFDSGLRLNLKEILKESPRALATAFLWFIASVFIVGYLLHYLTNMDLGPGLYLGASIGGLSAPVALGVLRKDIVPESIRTRVVIESIVSDVICIVFAMAILDSILMGYTNPRTVSGMILAKVSTGLVIGALIGVVWLLIIIRLHRIFGEVEYEYMATIGLAILSYTIAEFSQASGGIAALAFGLTISNRWIFEPIVDFSQYEKLFERVNSFLKRFSNEVSFFMKALFFTQFGMMYMFTDWISMYLGLLLVAYLMAARYIITFFTMHDKPGYTLLVGSMVGKGLAAAVLIQLPLAMGLEWGRTVFSIGVNAILFSLIITTIAMFILQRGKSTGQVVMNVEVEGYRE